MPDLLTSLGRRVREARLARGWTMRELAGMCGVSPRFLVQLEAGRGNISVRRLADVAAALETTSSALLADTGTPAVAAPRIIALLGPRGAGKTTVGKRLARRLDLPFVELDQRIEDAAHLTLAELFSMHGEAHYRRLEREVLDGVLGDGRAMVLATGGGLVTAPETFARLRRSAVTVWLRARAEDHWRRVVRQGDRRPMVNQPQAMADLRGLLASREPLYAEADYRVDTSGLTVAEVVAEVERRVAAERAPRRTAPAGRRRSA